MEMTSDKRLARVIEIESVIQEIHLTLKKGRISEHKDVLLLSKDMFKLYQEMYDYGQEEHKRKACRESLSRLLPVAEKLLQVKSIVEDDDLLQDAYTFYRSVYAFVSRRSLEHFIDFMEWDRTSHNKIYYNRKEVLRPFVYYLNKARFNDQMKYVIASYPPSYGKTFVMNYFSAWVFGVDFNDSILRISYSEDLVNACSRSVIDLLESPLFSEVFPNFAAMQGKIFDKSKESEWKLKGADVLTSHYARTRDGSITGVRAKCAIIIDDITKGAAESTNSKLHADLYDKWKSEWYARRNGKDVMFIFGGTMWSPEDILNRIAQDQASESDLFPSKMFPHCWETEDGSTAIIRVPLLDENDKSTCEAVYTTEEALKLRKTTDDYLFSCVFQQDPIAPTGLEFAYELLNTYLNVPLAISEYSYAVLDPARKGKDNVSMPILREDAEGNHFLVDVLFEKRAMEELYDDIIAMIIEHKVMILHVENNIDTSLAYLLRGKLKEAGYDGICDIVDAYATVNKEQRIMAARGIIKRKIWFRDKTKYTENSPYGRFMRNLTRYSFDRANTHDDAPDSLALYSTKVILNQSGMGVLKPIDRKSLGF